MSNSSENKYSLTGPFPEVLAEVQEEIDYWASRQNEGYPESIWEEGIRNRLAQLDRIEKRLNNKPLTEDKPQPAANQKRTAKWRPWGDHPLVIAVMIFLAVAAIVVPIFISSMGSHGKSSNISKQSAIIQHSPGTTIYQAGHDIILPSSPTDTSSNRENPVHLPQKNSITPNRNTSTTNSGSREQLQKFTLILRNDAVPPQLYVNEKVSLPENYSSGIATLRLATGSYHVRAEYPSWICNAVVTLPLEKQRPVPANCKLR